jgi:hypothetical protein
MFFQNNLPVFRLTFQVTEVPAHLIRKTAGFGGLGFGGEKTPQRANSPAGIFRSPKRRTGAEHIPFVTVAQL